MSKRMRELAEQADDIEILPDEEFCDTDFLADIDPRRVKKFTELIVRECLNQCYNRGMNDELYAGQLKAATYIEEHFGVEN